MKNSIFFNILIFIAMALTACTQAVPGTAGLGNRPEVEEVEPTVASFTEADQAITGLCSRNSNDVRLLIDSVHGYCLQYPVDYDIYYPNASEVKLVHRFVLNTNEPSAAITVQVVGEQTLEEAADRIANDYAVPGKDVIRQSMTVGGEPAILLDGLSGQDANRQVVILHDGRLYTLYFIQMDRDQPELYARAERMFNTIIQSFNFRPDSNMCADCPAPEADPRSASISGWVWLDQCDSGQDGQPAPDTVPPGCVMSDSPLGLYHAEGVMAIGEPLVDGVIVTLGEGACPSTGIAETTTISTDLSYSFNGLRAGTYCVSIDPQREPNASILLPGIWTFPAVSQEVMGHTVTVGAGEYRGMVNFGWDLQLEP